MVLIVGARLNAQSCHLLGSNSRIPCERGTEIFPQGPLVLPRASCFERCMVSSGSKSQNKVNAVGHVRRRTIHNKI